MVLIAHARNVNEGFEGERDWALTRPLAGIGQARLVKLRVAGVVEAVKARIAELGLDGRVHPVNVDLPLPWASTPPRRNWPPRFERIDCFAWQVAAWRTLRRRRIGVDIA
jgi:hypothetical protein